MIFRVRQWLPSRRWEWILRVITRPNDRQSHVSTTSGIYAMYSPTLLLQPPLCLVVFSIHMCIRLSLSLSLSLFSSFLSANDVVAQTCTTCPDTQVCRDCRNRTDTFTWICTRAFEFESDHQRQGDRRTRRDDWKVLSQENAAYRDVGKLADELHATGKWPV